jgi:HK97 gp10 family phage protein
MSMKIRFEGGDKMEVELGQIPRESENAGIEIQKKCAKIIKNSVEKRLRSISQKSAHANSKKRRRVHMADDVRTMTKKDKYGDIIVKVQGGKQTGTLWHIVNDGTYRSRATHFMDGALADCEAAVESAVDEELRKVFG